MSELPPHEEPGEPERPSPTPPATPAEDADGPDQSAPTRKLSRSERRTEAQRREAARRRERARFEAEARRTAPSRPESSPLNKVLSMVLGAVIVALAYILLKHFL